jgi:WD40 repeat protein
VEKGWRWCRRNPVVAALSATIFLLLNVLAVGSLYQSARLGRALRAEKAKRWESLRDQARAVRKGRQVGQRVEALRSIAEAMQLPLPSGHSLAELRTEAIAALALPDIEVVREWEGGWTPGIVGVAFDATLQQCARLAQDGTITICRTDDDRPVIACRESMESTKAGEEAYLRFSRDGRYLAAWFTQSRRLVVRRLDGPQPVVVYRAQDARPSWADFSPDSTQFVYPHTDGRIAAVDLASGRARHLRVAGEGVPRDVVFAPEGREFAVSVRGRARHAVEIFDLATGELQATLLHPQPVMIPAWSPDGRTLATGCDDGLIRLWEVSSGKVVFTLEGHQSFGICCSFDSPGQRLVSNDWDGIVRLWEPSSGRQLLSFAAEGYQLLRLSPDNHLVVRKVGDATKLQLLRLHGSQEYRTIVLPLRPDAGRPLRSIIAGGQLAAVHTSDHIALVDLQAGREVASLPGREVILAEPTSGLLTSGASGLLRWPVQLDSGESRVLRLGPPVQLLPKGLADHSAASTEGQTIVVPNGDRGAVVIHRGPPLETSQLQPQQAVSSCAIGPDGRWIATGSHGSKDGFAAKIWDAATGRLVKALPLALHCDVAFSPDGRWLLTTASHCRLWQVGAWTEGPVIGGASGCFAPDGRLVAVEDSLGALRLVETETGGEVARLEAPSKPASGRVVLHPTAAA